jgi:ribosome biogenesis protein BRX1
MIIKSSNLTPKFFLIKKKNVHRKFFKSVENFKEKKIPPFLFFNLRKKNKIKFLINDFIRLAPHSKKRKIKKKKKNFDFIKFMIKKKKYFSFFFFEYIKKKNINYIWMSIFPSNPLMQIEINDFKSLEKLSFLGNCCRWSHPLISFDIFFKKKPHLNIFKKIITAFFSSKNNDKRVEPFLDHIISLCWLNNKIWFRVYQIIYSKKNKNKNILIDQLVEIGPRIILNILKIWSNIEKKNCIYDSFVLNKHEN